MHSVGLDIGGANLKGADREGRAVCRPFAVWREPQRLGDELAELLTELGPCDLLAVTMTAELADCYATKAEGVAAVLRAVERAAGRVPVVVWQTGGEFVSPDEARDFPMLAAAANWHALATWVGRAVPRGRSLLIDIGSTTTDLIPLLDGRPVPAGLTDRERLLAGELVYTGARRTPLCAVAPAVPHSGSLCPLAAELFATTFDVYLLLGELPEDPADTQTANGSPATCAAAHDRLARMLCCDRHELPRSDAETIARFLADAQRTQIRQAVDRVLAAADGPPDHVILTGSGAFLAERIHTEHPPLQSARPVRLADMLPPAVSEAACAFAVARLAAEQLYRE